MADLQEYFDKREFDETPEPKGDVEEGHDPPIFVIHEHDASSHHFDLRLEVDGVLKSWAVPKGPSTDPSEKQLAIEVEDHPLDYADFEGKIPEDEYGGGPTIVWDTGPYQNLKDDKSMQEALDDGHATFELHGEKLQGGYSLIRYDDSDQGSEDQTNWLLVKIDDDEADARRNPTETEPESVLSGREVDEVDEEKTP